MDLIFSIVIVLIVLGVIIFFQYRAYSATMNLSESLGALFPSSVDALKLKKTLSNIPQIQAEHNHSKFNDLIYSLNQYLYYNGEMVGDYHLMKDMVDRTTEKIEDEIRANLPIPLYWGLIGTMFSLIVGIILLFLTGGFTKIFQSNSSDALSGIQNLLLHVAIAMIASVSGIVFTINNTYVYKKNKSILDQNKNNFLTWIQQQLLPNVPGHIYGALSNLSNNLSEFNKNFSTNLDKLNKVFAGNIQNLDNTLENFVQSYEKLDKLIQRIEDIKIDKLASINQEVYEKLKNASEEIGNFAEFLLRSNQYLSNIEKLTNKLDEYEKRTQIIEKAGKFYDKNEKWLAENIEIATRHVKNSIENFIEGFEKSVKQFSEKTEGIYSTLENTIKNALQEIPNTAKSYSLEILEGTKSTFEEQRKYVNIIIEEQKKHFHSIFENQKQLFDSLAQIPVISKEIENLTPLKNEVIELKEAILIQNQTMKSQNEKMVNLLQDLVKEFASFSEIIDKLPIRNKLPELTSSKLQTIDLPVSESSKSLSASKSEELEILKVPKVHLPLYLKIMMIIAFVMIIIASTFVVWSSLRYLNFI